MTLGYMEGPPFGGGEYYFKYHCHDTAEFNAALEKFGAIQVPKLVRHSSGFGGEISWIADEKSLLLVVHDGSSVDWTFTVWIPQSFNHLFNSVRNFDVDNPNFHQAVPPPRIDVYVRGDSPIDWKEVKVPANVRVLDRRAQAAPVEAQRGGVVKGCVFDMATHKTVSGAEIILVRRSEKGAGKEAARAKTDAQGVFAIREIPAGNYELQAVAQDYTGRRIGSYDNDNGHAFVEYETFLAHAASLKGTVKDQQGKPLSGVQVKTQEIVGTDGLGYKYQATPSGTTDRNGRFEIKALPEGSTLIWCQAPGLHQETPSFEYYPVSAKPFPENRDISIIMTGTGTVRGQVIGPDGKPPTRSFIAEIEPRGGNKVGSWGGSMNCKEGGRFEFTGVPPGQYVITAKPNPRRSGEDSSPEPVTVEAGKTVKLTITSQHTHSMMITPP